MDKEILDTYLKELDASEKELIKIIEKLRNDLNQSSLYEEYSKIINEVYQSTAIMGFKVLTEYSLKLKEIAQKTFERGTSRKASIFALLEKAPYLLNNLSDSMFDKEKLKQYRHNLHIEIAKADNILKTVFF